MSDDIFIREVNDEIRQDRAKALWTRFAPVLFAAVALIIVATIGWVGYEYWREQRSGAAGDAFSQALTLASEGKNDEALEALDALEKEGHGAYPVLARMRAAGVLAAKGDVKGAVAAFDAVAADNAIPMSLRDMARLRAGYLLVDGGTYAEVAQRVEQLSADTNPLRASAREALGLSAWKEGKTSDALKLFEQITADDQSPQGAQERAGVMVELIRASGVTS